MIAAGLTLLWTLSAAPAKAAGPSAGAEALSLVLDADALWKRNERAKAEKRLRRALELAPDDFVVLDRLTALLRERDRPWESLEMADRLRRLRAVSHAMKAESARQRGETLLVLGRYADAGAEGRAAAQAEPGEFDSQWLLARVALKAGRPDAALEGLAGMDRAVARSTGGVAGAGQAAWLRAELRAAPDDALEKELNGVLARDPGSLPALEALNKVLQRQHRYLEALGVGQRYVDASSAHGERAAGYLMMGETCLLMGRLAGAEASARRALDEDSDSFPAFWQLARALEAQGKHSAARRALKRMEETAETPPDKEDTARQAAGFELQ